MRPKLVEQKAYVARKEAEAKKAMAAGDHLSTLCLASSSTPPTRQRDPLRRAPLTPASSLAAGIKQAKALYAYTLKHGYGHDLTKQYMSNLKALRSAYAHRPHHQVDIE